MCKESHLLFSSFHSTRGKSVTHRGSIENYQLNFHFQHTLISTHQANYKQSFIVTYNEDYTIIWTSKSEIIEFLI